MRTKGFVSLCSSKRGTGVRWMGFSTPDVGVGFERRFVFRSGESGREAVSGGWDDGHLRKFGFGAGTLDDEYLFCR
jgi:hypothetical protein